MAAIFQTTFSNAIFLMKMYEFWLRFHWSLFLRVQLTIFHHWFRKWLGDKPLSEPMMVSLLMHICITCPVFKTKGSPMSETDKFSGGLATYGEFPDHFMIKQVLTPETFWSSSDLSLNTALGRNKLNTECFWGNINTHFCTSILYNLSILKWQMILKSFLKEVNDRSILYC